MKIIVLNYSGNVGKSTIARHLLSARMNNAKILPVESINSDGTEEDALRGRQFSMVSEVANVLDDLVVDVGASNVEDFLSQMAQYKGSHEDFDYFVIPTVVKGKQIRDTISTIEALAEQNVPADKIRVVFNMIEHDDGIDDHFSGLLKYYKDKKTFTLRKEAIVRVSDIYLKVGVLNIKEIAADTTDLKALLQTAKTTEEKVKISRQIGTRRLAIGVTEELDAVFATMFK